MIHLIISSFDQNKSINEQIELSYTRKCYRKRKSTTTPILLMLLAGVQTKTLRPLHFGSLEDCLSQTSKTLANIDVPLHRSTNVNGSVVFCPKLSLFFVQSHLKVAFVAHQNQLSLWRSHFGHFKPFGSDTGEGFWVGEVEYQHDSIAAFEVGGDNGPVLFLAGSIPDVKLDRLFLDFGFFDFEVNGCDSSSVFFVVAFDVPPKESCFAHVRISHQNQLVLQFVVVRVILVPNHYLQQSQSLSAMKLA